MIIASLDIGSNTALLLIAEVSPGEERIVPLREEQMIPRISEGLAGDGKINNKSIERLLSVLEKYFDIINKYKCDKILISGTNAFRKASNSDEIRSIIKEEFKADLNVLSGEEEAELAFIGTNYGGHKDYRLVIDIGGGSTEIILGKRNNIIYKRSFKVGVVSLCEMFSSLSNSREPIIDFLKLNMEKDLSMLPLPGDAPVTAVALAGTPVTLASIHKSLSNYEAEQIEGFKLKRDAVSELTRYLEKYSPDQLLKMYPELLGGREDLILIGAYILLYIMNILNLDDVLVSTKGIRYGAILKYLSTEN